MTKLSSLCFRRWLGKRLYCMRTSFCSCPNILSNQITLHLARNFSGQTVISNVRLNMRTLSDTQMIIARKIPSISAILQRPYSQASNIEIDANLMKVRGIQKSALATRKPRRKPASDGMQHAMDVFNITAYSTAEEYDLESLKDEFLHHQQYTVISLPEDMEDDALHVAGSNQALHPQDMFFFREGSVVFWNCSSEERSEVFQLLKKHQDSSYDEAVVQSQYDTADVFITGGQTKLHKGEFHLQHPDVSDQTECQVDKYTFSNAMALSVKLSIWEASFDRYVDSIEDVLQELKAGGKIKMAHSDVLRKIGELFTLRHQVNLSSDLLTTPDIYWDRKKHEELYEKTCNFLSIHRRTRVINEKLILLCELMDQLNDYLKDKHHTKLEWMIIILIMIEVVFQIYHIAEKFV